MKFSTIVHELGHLFLGHLGPDKELKIPGHRSIHHAQLELEAESVSYLVCVRNGVHSKAESYLVSYVQNNTTIHDIDLHQVMHAAGQIESVLGLAAHTRYEKPTREHLRPKSL